MTLESILLVVLLVAGDVDRIEIGVARERSLQREAARGSTTSAREEKEADSAEEHRGPHRAQATKNV